MIVSLLALTVLLGAGVAIWRSVGDDLAQALVTSAPEKSAPPEPKKKAAGKLGTPGRPIGEEEPALWSEVAIYRAGAGRTRPIVIVRRGKRPTEWTQNGLYQGLPLREVVRQGLMLTTREELGALVRDVPIGDPDLDEKPDATCRIGSRLRLTRVSSVLESVLLVPIDPLNNLTAR